MTACLSLGRAIAVEGELKERSEVSRQQSAELRFLWPDVPDSLSADGAFLLSRFSAPGKAFSHSPSLPLLSFAAFLSRLSLYSLTCLLF